MGSSFSSSAYNKHDRIMSAKRIVTGSASPTIETILANAESSHALLRIILTQMKHTTEASIAAATSSAVTIVSGCSNQ